jgi:Holliday junction resolvase
MNSKMKGKRGELELAAVLREAGFEARRGQQYCGANGDADVVHSIPGVHLECKRVEKLNLRSAYEQAVSDAGADMPVVVHRMSRQPWLVTLSLADLLALIRVGDGLN